MSKSIKMVLVAALIAWGALCPLVVNHILGLLADPVAGLTGVRLAGSGSGLASALFSISMTLAIFVRPSLLLSFFGPAERAILRGSIIWGMLGTVLGLVLTFFFGVIDQVGLVYPAVLAAGFVVGACVPRLVLGLLRSLPMLFAVASAIALIVFVHGPFQGFALAALPTSPAEVAKAVARSPWTILGSFLVSVFVAFLVTRRLFGAPTSLAGRLFVQVFWVVAAHVVWLVLLFATGAVVYVSRWMPIGTALILAVPTLAYTLYLTSKGVIALHPGEVYDLARAEGPGGKPELFRGTLTGQGKRAWILSYTGVSNEPRVLRQAEALVKAGWDVVVCGYDGHSKRPDDWHFIRLPTTENFRSRTLQVLSLATRIGKRLAASKLPAPIGKWGGRLAHGSTPLWLHTRLSLTAFAKEHPELMADLVISHDYHTADVGYAIAQTYGAKFSMDIHEYVAGQYFNDPQWVKWQRPISVATQEYYLARADVVTVVCEGIGKLIYEENPMKQPPITIRSVPFPQKQAFRPTGPRIRVLYHGDISPRREILAAIQSMKLWRDDIDFVLRGASDPAYMGEIKRLVAKLGLEQRVFIEESVPFNRIVPEANKADIGYFSFKGGSPQIRFTLPNKLFEYVMAGLCLVVGDTDEVALVVREHGVGVLIPEHTPEAIAATINRLTREDIDAFKKASLKAAEVLNWDTERQRMLEAYDRALP